MTNFTGCSSWSVLKDLGSDRHRERPFIILQNISKKLWTEETKNKGNNMEESVERYWFDMMSSSFAASKIFWAQGVACFELLAALPPSSAEVRFGISAASRFSQNPLPSWLVWTADLCFSALRHLDQKVMLDSCRIEPRTLFDLFHNTGIFCCDTRRQPHLKMRTWIISGSQHLRSCWESELGLTTRCEK